MSAFFLPHYCPLCRRQWHCAVPGCDSATVLPCGKHQRAHPAAPATVIELQVGPEAHALSRRLGTSSDAAQDPELSAVLLALLSAAKAVLAERFVGMYLRGSLAAGDFDEDSDVDFVVAVADDVPEEQLDALQRVHARVYSLDSRWAQHLEGAYITTQDLRRFDPASPLHLYLDHGSRVLERSDHDHSVLHRYVLREHGVALDGPDPRSLIDPIPLGALRREALANLRTWLEPLAVDPTPLENRWMQAYAVLTICRMLHTIRHDSVVSKIVAVRWAKQALDVCWVDLIDRAWTERPESFLKARQRADPDESIATVAFIRYALQWSDQDGELVR